MVYLCRDCEHYHKYESCKNLGFCCEYNKSRIIKVPIDEARKQYSPCSTCYETSYKRERQPKKDTTNWFKDIRKNQKNKNKYDPDKKPKISAYLQKKLEERKAYLRQRKQEQVKNQSNISPAFKKYLQKQEELRKQKEIQKQMQEVLESAKHKSKYYLF
jgi:hypothetical protein